jgi:predicted ATP-grasp superfamily ATP-dependent carboligase
MPSGGCALFAPQAVAAGLMGRRVLATDAQERAVLAAIRCLRDGGFEVTATATSRTAPGLWSRAPVHRRLAPDPRQAVDAFIAKHQELVTEREYDLLVPGTDASLLAISLYRDRLTPHVRIGLPSHAVVRRALDKSSLAQAAADCGLAPPDERTCVGMGETLAAAREFGYPVVVKPVQTVIELNGVARRECSRLLEEETELRPVLDLLGGACIVQRCVRGSILSFGGVATDSGLLGYVVSRYARTWPALAGNVAFSETIAPPAGLVDKVEELVGKIGWFGLFELELIESEHTCAAIDFNPRAYGSLSLAAAAGVPLSALATSWLLGERPPPPSQARVGVKYRWEDADLRHLAWRLGSGLAPRAALALARPQRGTTHAYFQLRDPAPLVARAVQIVQRAQERGSETT